MLRAIIFDMDGVICDSEPLHMKAFQRVLTEEAIVITDQEYYDKYLAHDDRGSFEAAFQARSRPEIDAQLMKSLLARKARYFDDLMKAHLVIYPGVDAFVRKALRRHALAVASGARRLEVEFVLKKAKMRDCFTSVVSADEVKNGKPQPEAFQYALSLLNERRLDGTPAIEPGQCLVIEDSPRCIRTARALGMKTIGMASSYKAEELRDADLVINSFVGFALETAEKLFS
ncbi:MAG TPA: HAD family phosphatase [Elusimicrobiota bacterium]|nr:HAD family phosphatase [Elusimicrobiota bacterium]